MEIQSCFWFNVIALILVESAFESFYKLFNTIFLLKILRIFDLFQVAFNLIELRIKFTSTLWFVERKLLSKFHWKHFYQKWDKSFWEATENSQIKFLKLILIINATISNFSWNVPHHYCYYHIAFSRIHCQFSFTPW